ncbi:hypothetical protein V2J09_010654 [Rumex salicifolius]
MKIAESRLSCGETPLFAVFAEKDLWLPLIEIVTILSNPIRDVCYCYASLVGTLSKNPDQALLGYLIHMMGVDFVNESWFSSLWRTPRARAALRSEKSMVGILAFEVTSLMSKVVNMWNTLGDRQISMLKEDMFSSFGILKLVSDDENQLMEFAFAEVFQNLGYVAQSVMMLAKRCSDPIYTRLEEFFSNPNENSIEWLGWAYNRKKMEKKVRKMSIFIASTSQLYHEMEVLLELEQTLRRMQMNPDTSRVKLLEYQQKVSRQHQEVKKLQDMSPWTRNYNYVVRLLVKSLFTILERIKVIFRINNQDLFVGEKVMCEKQNSDNTLSRCRSLVHPHALFSQNQASIFFSGPMSMSRSRLGLGIGSSRARRNSHLKAKRFGQSGPFKGCMLGGTDFPVIETHLPRITDGSSRATNKTGPKQETSKTGSIILGHRKSILSRQFMSSITPASTLGSSALSLHYANIIILVEKLGSLPHLVGPDARDDLYNMLPSNIKTSLRTKLKQYGKSACPAVCDSTLATEWGLAMNRILEWLSPLAHNTLRWQSERNFEKQNVMVKPNVLLVHTLHFANQAKTEDVLLELLMGLNYLCRCSKDGQGKAVVFGYTDQS